MSKMTIVEIAKMAGVSPSAVSIVLNDRKGVSEDTRKKVKEIIERLQYVPNPNSRRLLFNKTDNIAILFKRSLSPMEHFFHSELNRVILQECESTAYNLVFASVTIDNGVVTLPNVVRTYDVDGIILYGDADPLILSSIRKTGIPCVVVDSHKATPEIPSVSADYSVAAYTAASYLADLGHRELAFIGPSALSDFGAQTFSGFKNALEEHNIVIPMNWIHFEADDEKSAYVSMEKILSLGRHPSGVVCAADIYAIGVIKCLKQYSMKIPEEISVIGIDDIILSSYIDPPLTTIRIDKVEMGRMAMEILIKKINKQHTENLTVRSDNLIIRGTTAQPHRRRCQ